MRLVPFKVRIDRYLFGTQVFRIKPPMCITKADVDVAVDTLEKAVKAYVQ